MLKNLDYMSLFDYVMEGMDINSYVADFTAELAENETQYIFQLGAVLDDIQTVMNRFAIDGDEKKASRECHFKEFEEEITALLEGREQFIKACDERNRAFRA